MVVSVLVFAFQARELARQSRLANEVALAANEVAATQAYRELLLYYKRVIDVFIRHPELHGRFFGEATETLGAADRVRLQVVAEQLAAMLDVALLTSRQLASYGWIVDEWKSFITKEVTSSPVFRSIVRDNPGEWPQLEPFVADFDASQAAAEPA